jgi:hypothetical protein
MKEAKKIEELSAARARAIRQAWVDRNKGNSEARNTLLQLEGWLLEHSKGLDREFLRCSRFTGGVGRVVKNGTLACVNDDPAALAQQLLAGKSLEDIILGQQEAPRLKAYYASIHFNEEAHPNVASSANEDLPALKRWNSERAAVLILKAAIELQKRAVLAKTLISMEKFSKTVSTVRAETARDFLAALAELRCAVEPDQALVEGLHEDEIACLRPRPFPLQILSSEAVQWLLDAVSQGMLSQPELAGLQLETVHSAEPAPAPEESGQFLQCQV